MKIFTSIPIVRTTQSGTTYTLALTDAGTHVAMTNASANTVTVPPNSTHAFEIGSQIVLSQYGAGTTTLAAGSGVTINSKGALLSIGGQFSRVMLEKIGTNEWDLYGDLA